MGQSKLIFDIEPCAAMPAREAKANLAYAAHAANVLPELLAAAKNLQDNWERNLTEPIARLSEAIDLAENVPGVERSRTRRSG